MSEYTSEKPDGVSYMVASPGPTQPRALLQVLFEWMDTRGNCQSKLSCLYFVIRSHAWHGKHYNTGTNPRQLSWLPQSSLRLSKMPAIDLSAAVNSSIPAPVLDVDVGSTLGSLLIGNVLGITLWGLEAFQM
jgi:hypothetical protein